MNDELLNDLHAICTEGARDMHVDRMPDGSHWLDARGYNYRYPDLNSALADALLVTVVSGGNAEDWYAVLSYVDEKVATAVVTHIPGYDGNPDGDTFDKVVHSNQRVVPLVEYHSEAPLFTRGVKGIHHSVYLTHPEVGPSNTPFLIKNSQGDDIGPYFRTIQEAKAFLDGMAWESD